MRRLRSIVDGLTLRGKGLIAVGLGLALGAVLSGQRDLLSVALVAICLPIISFIVVARAGFTLGCTRTVSTRHITVGESAEVTLLIENLGSRRTATMLLFDAVPPSMGPAIRRIAPPLQPGEQRRIVSSITPQRRGRFVLGPLSVVALDPLGLVRIRRSFRSTDSVLVTPRVVPLTAGSPHAEHLGHGDATLAALAARGDDDVVPREYRVGDDLRRIHWRASARSGQMMVRREEQPWTRQATLILDDRHAACVGSGPDASFEVALSAVASIGAHLMRSGFDILVTGIDGRPLTTRLSGIDGHDLLLDTLALAGPREEVGGGDHLEATAWRADFVIAIVMADDTMGIRLAHQHPRRAQDLGIALILDPADWGEPSAGADTIAAQARTMHWRTSDLPRSIGAHRNPLAAAWAHALQDVSTDPLSGSLAAPGGRR